MKRVVADVETDGFLDALTRLHCLVIRDLDSATVVSCTDDARGREMGYRSIQEGLDILSSAERIYGHNWLTFDGKAIRKVYPTWQTTASERDTYIIAQMRWAHVKAADFDKAKLHGFPGHLAGSHTLEAWGHRLGRPKMDYKQWCTDNAIGEQFAEWRPEMQTYCEADTVTTKALVQLIRSSEVSPESIEIEHSLAEFLGHQMENGWPFDMDGAVALVGELSAKRAAAGRKLIDHFKGWYVSLGEMTPKVNNKTSGYVKGVPFTKLKYVEFNPSSRDHIANRLQALYGWKPESFTDSGKPEVDEGTLKGLVKQHAIVAEVIEYLMCDKRLGMISEGKQAWLKHATDQRPYGGKLTGMHHIHPRIKQNHAVTHRAAASSPPVHGTPKVGNPYGSECRALWCVPVGWRQVGADVAGLELRNLAHYLGRYDGGNFTRVLLEGDPHTEAQNLLTEFVGPGKKGRDTAKTFRYAYLYGGGDGKLGSIVAPTVSKDKQASIGKKVRALFVNGTPGLKYLDEALKSALKSKGYVILPDGRRAYVRHAHAVLNTLLQGSGAIICKRWIVDYSRVLRQEFGEQGWRGQWAALGWAHDETQTAARPEIAERVGEIKIAAIRGLTDHFQWRCPLDGEAKIGGNWRDTH